MAKPSQKSYLGRGALSRLGELLDETACRSIFLVKDPGAFNESGAARLVKQAAADRKLVSFDAFSSNPKWPDIMDAVEAFRQGPCDLILAVGGGSCIDIAKLVSLFALQHSAPEDLLLGSADPVEPVPPVVAIPTTAGSGSEATHFAVAYRDGAKYSVTHEKLLPRYSVVDPALTDSLPPLWTACSGLDAFCQAVESLWAVGSNEESAGYSRRAITLAARHLANAALNPTREDRDGMSEAAHLAGKAINISRTTACHALSYTLTSKLQVPHGQAVAVTLGAVMAYNYGAGPEDCLDPRGPGHVRARIREILELLGADDIEAGRRKIDSLIKSAGLSPSIFTLGVKTPEDIEVLAEGVNAERLGNNPRRFSRKNILAMLQELQSRSHPGES